MIAKLTGTLDSTDDGQAIIDVNGVGYQVFCSRRSLDRWGSLGSRVVAFIETHVREDHFHLYGFAEEAERAWYRLLTTVQGVGGRHALSILSVSSPDELTTAIAAQDKAMLTRADGVGPKLAGRILSELKDKVGGISLAPKSAAAPSSAAVPPTGAADDAVSALINLGYGRSEAFGAIARVSQTLGDRATVEELIPAALKELAS
ncbi:MAG: Holliday junction branch migration protein RuvA [Pseudomonadota bacterium]